ncbi:MAG TPA: transcriptional regulator [Verrucomicrobiales bacterium]|nr:transcriptional regulator [Verrucomicrobiales bacterium]
MEINEAVQVLTALAHPSRLEVFRLLVSLGRLCAGELAERLKLPKPTLSFHLKELSRSGLIEAEREGRVIFYGVRVSGFRELMDFLTEDCCQGRPELCLPNSRRLGKAESCC